LTLAVKSLVMNWHTKISPTLIADDDDGWPDDGLGEGHGALLLERTREKVEEPPLYQVLLLNDDFTPMEFVVETLQRFFRLSREQSTQVMLEVHTKGKGVCGVFPAQIAETKVAQVNAFARENQHPLLCVMEKQ